MVVVGVQQESQVGNKAGLFVKLCRDGMTRADVNHRQVVVIANGHARAPSEPARVLDPEQVMDPDEFFGSFKPEAE